MKRALVVCVMTGALVPLGAGLAHADQPQQQGWWSQSNTGVVALPPPPDVPPEGLYVAASSDPAGAGAISALVYRLPMSAMAGELQLTATASSLLGPIKACVLSPESIGFSSPTVNGPWADAPEYDCASGQADGAFAGRVVSFGVAPLVREETLAVALVPDGPGRMAFEKPGPDSLQITATPPAPPAPPATAAPPATTRPATAAPATPAQPTRPAAGPVAAPTTRAPTSARTAPSTTGAALAPSTTRPVPPPPAQAAAPAPAAPVATAAPVSGNLRGSMWTKAGGVLGALVMIGLLIFYAHGYGPLGARYSLTPPEGE